MKRHTAFGIGLVLLSGCGDDKTIGTAPQLNPDLSAVLDRANKDAVWEGADIGLAVRGSKLAELVRSINTLKPDSRQINIELVSEVRKLADTGNYYVEFYDLPANRAAARIETVNAEWTKDGMLNVDAKLAVIGDLKIHGHYKPAKVGGHVGFKVNVQTVVNGQLAFQASDTALVMASFKLNPTKVSYAIGTEIKDQNKVCTSAHVPCGTWRDPLRLCLKQLGCATLWDYSIPISISDSVPIGGAVMNLPISVQVPTEFLVDTKVAGIPFQRSIALTAKPVSFSSDARGLFLKIGVDIKQKQDQKVADSN